MKTKTKKAGRVLVVGAKVLIRTVTSYHVGEVTFMDREAVVLKDAAWVADTGRFHDAVKNKTLKEVEPFVDPVEVFRASIVDVTTWGGTLPMAQK